MRSFLVVITALTLANGSQSSAQNLAAQAGRVPLVELFTSQSCSSCPPADAVMQRLSREPGVLVILRPVTYWDHEGWRDTLARNENTAKQSAYGRSLHVTVYTPQAIVDGRAAAIGSQESAVRGLVAAARVRAEAASLQVTRTGQGQIHIVANSADGATISVVGLSPSEQVAISRGENHGRTITYVNVVRTEHSLGRARGARASFDATLDTTHNATRWAVIAQDGNAGAVRAAALAP